jgi:hypothetical protein
MKRVARVYFSRGVLIAVVASFCLGGAVVKAATSSTPEINNANATLSLRPQGTFSQRRCTGEDAVPYVTIRGTWTGPQTETTPGVTDYDLSGTVTVSGVVWTINLTTGRGVLTGTVKLISTAGIPEYSGKLTLITEGVPATGAAVPGRGWIVAGFLPADEGVPPAGEDNLLANTEWMISGSFGVSAAFGDAAPFAGIPNFSVVTNVAPKVTDGVC